MDNNCLILCGESPTPRPAAGTKVVNLHLWGQQQNVNLKISDISQRMTANIPDVLLDLLEIAAYVYCADQATPRGGDGTRDIGRMWRRTFDFRIPVRNPSLWSSPKVQQHLSETLGFLSDEEYRFTFSKLSHSHPADQYFEFAKTADSEKYEDVVLFSGGLDSLAGAITETVVHKRNVALVSHRSNPKIFTRQRDLVAGLRQRAKANLLHVPIWVHKDKELGREYTQRTRSFLFASLGVVVARILNLWKIRFYENGIMSINLPISEQLLGSRASRTTHPAALRGFAALFSEVLNHDFKVENPFFWMTKTDVVKMISQAGCEDLIKHSTSCTHTWEMTTLHSHCGRCSQCIDRRFATLASGNAANDPAEMYAADLLTAERKPGTDTTLVESYIRNATAVKKMSEIEFFTKFQELNRILPHLNGNIDKSAEKVLALHRHHAQQVCSVVEAGFKQYSAEILDGSLPESSLIALALPDKYKQKGSTEKKPLTTFPTPAGATWADVKITFADGETVSIVVRNAKLRAKYNEMGMVDGRGHKPDVQWELLLGFAEGHGLMTWDSPKASRKNQKRREILAQRLRDYFGLTGDPIGLTDDKKGWATKFEINPA